MPSFHGSATLLADHYNPANTFVATINTGFTFNRNNSTELISQHNSSFRPRVLETKLETVETGIIVAEYPPASQFLQRVRKSFLPNTLGLADSDHSVTFLARQYKVTPLFNALRPF